MTGNHDFSTGRLAHGFRADDPVVGPMTRDTSEAKTALVAHISREFRTPLILLLGPLQGILDSPASALAPASRSVLEGTRRNALKLLQTVDAAADVSAIDTSSEARQAIDLAAFTARLAENFRGPCDAAGLRLMVDCPPLAAPVAVNPEAWEKIVLNLVANAFTSTIEGTIEVRLRVPDNRAQLIVSDTGGGLSERELPYVFKHVDRASTRPDGFDRTGVGLPYVRDLVRLHQGSIDVLSTPGRGTTFTVVLPLEIRDAPAGSSRDIAADRRTAPATGGVSSGRGHVVIVEDHDETREYLYHALATAGFTVDALADGTAALAACDARAPDALVSDVLMPGLDGFALIERLRADERTAAIPVLLLSARGGEESRIEGIAAGADDYLVKPLSRRELVARVDGAVRLGRLRRETARREQERLHELSSRLVEVQEAERRQLSAELHDRTSPQLAAIQINLKMLTTMLSGRDTEDIQALLADTAHLIADTTVGIRDISSNLRPTVLDDGGLLPALAAYAQQFTQRTGVAVRLDTRDAPAPLAPALQSSLFRIVQEALTNCAKHAKAANVTIRLATDRAQLLLTIEDDGIGFDLASRSRSGLGLLTMRERAEFLGGSFSLDTRPGGGTRLEVRL
jgi:signal transduction histidine kinase